MTASNHLFSALDNLCQSREQAFLEVVSKTFNPVGAVERNYSGRIAVLVEKSLMALLSYYHDDGRLITIKGPLSMLDLRNKKGRVMEDLYVGGFLKVQTMPDKNLTYFPITHLFIEPFNNSNHELLAHESTIDQILMRTDYQFLNHCPRETLWRER